MAIIGWIVLLLAGLYFVFQALAGAYLTMGFAGKIEWPHFIVTGAIGAGILYVAFTNSPISVAIST